MSYQGAAVVGALLMGWALVLSTVFDKRATAALVRRGAGAPQFVKRTNRRWLVGWLVVWILGVALAGDDPDNREAAVVVVPMILAQGPWVFWVLVCTPADLVKAGADPEVAVRTLRAGRWFAYLAGFLCVAAWAVTARA